MGSREVPQKFGPDRFSHFDVYLIQRDKQSNYPKDSRRRGGGLK